MITQNLSIQILTGFNMCQTLQMTTVMLYIHVISVTINQELHLSSKNDYVFIISCQFYSDFLSIQILIGFNMSQTLRMTTARLYIHVIAVIINQELHLSSNNDYVYMYIISCQKK